MLQAETVRTWLCSKIQAYLQHLHWKENVNKVTPNCLNFNHGTKDKNQQVEMGDDKKGKVKKKKKKSNIQVLFLKSGSCQLTFKLQIQWTETVLFSSLFSLANVSIWRSLALCSFKLNFFKKCPQSKIFLPMFHVSQVKLYLCTTTSEKCLGSLQILIHSKGIITT